MSVTDVIEVGMAHDCEQRLLSKPGELCHQADHSQPGIEQQAAVATAHEPDVAAVENIDIGLEQVCDAVAAVGAGVPLGGVAYFGRVHGTVQWYLSPSGLGRMGRRGLRVAQRSLCDVNAGLEGLQAASRAWSFTYRDAHKRGALR